MRIRMILADPAGNLTALALTAVAPDQRAQIAARIMRAAAVEQVAFIDEESLLSPLPRMDMMGGEFCGNATRAFGLYAAGRRGKEEMRICVSASGAREPVPVTLDLSRARALARMPLPFAVERIEAAGRQIPVVRMEGIAHAVLRGEDPSPELARAVLAAMPKEDAQGVLFAQGNRMTPLVYVAATDTCVWESSCGSGSVALAWLLSQGMPDGEHAFSFDEPGGTLEVVVQRRGGQAAAVTMGGSVALSAEREIDI